MSADAETTAWFVPRTGIGKALLGTYFVALVLLSLPVYDVAFNDPELLGPLPETAAWTYLCLALMNVVLVGTYYGLFKPWAEEATQYVDGLDDVRLAESAGRVAGTTSIEGDDD